MISRAGVAGFGGGGLGVVERERGQEGRKGLLRGRASTAAPGLRRQMLLHVSKANWKHQQPLM